MNYLTMCLLVVCMAVCFMDTIGSEVHQMRLPTAQCKPGGSLATVWVKPDEEGKVASKPQKVVCRKSLCRDVSKRLSLMAQAVFQGLDIY